MRLKKASVLALLKEHEPDFVSGEEICRKLGISRTAVWKHIQTLREDGYGIDAMSRSGYRLVTVPDRLYPQEIISRLDTEFIGRTVYYYDIVDSTNREARVLASRGAPDGALVVAEEQTGGRGRLGWGWFSPRSQGIWCSLVLRPGIQPAEAPPVTMLTAVAAASAVEKVTGLKPGIKWPNDLLAEGKKVCGILTEMDAELERVNFLVVGMGLNVNIPPENFPEELRETATSLHLAGNRPVSRLALLSQFLREFETCYRVWLKSGFGPVLQEWKKRCVTLNSAVRVSTARDAWEGWAEDVDVDGALILRLPDGSRQRFMAGEVSLRNRG
ncbi:MAG: biotin--[acetyl-CoA-carboxylase] ligase [Peptococcaceae bacterium]|nr:biotin--[acetyl-CoA-carboxylase] ligase [Peptococcaceae bacterium]